MREKENKEPTLVTGFNRLDNELDKRSDDENLEQTVAHLEMLLYRARGDMMNDNLMDVFKGVKLMGIYDETTGFPRLDNELRRDGADRDGDFTANLKAYNLDEEWARNRNREIEEEVRGLREVLDSTYVSFHENEEIHSKISELLQERDENYRKYYGLDKEGVGISNREIDEEDLLDEEWYDYEEELLDEEWAANCNREIEEEVVLLREYIEFLNNSYSDIDETHIVAMEERIKDLLEERDDNTYKYGLAGKEFERLYLEKKESIVGREFTKEELLDPKLLVSEEEDLVEEPPKTEDVGEVTLYDKLISSGIPMSVIEEKPEVNGETRFRFITEEMTDLYLRKNADYGDSFAQSLDEDGLLVSKIRIKDKFNRFSQLINNDALVSDESMRDTLIDMANYAAMTIMWMDKNE